MATSIIGMQTAQVQPMTFGNATTDTSSISDLPMSLRKCIIDRAIFGSQKVSKRLFRIACGWLGIISEAAGTPRETNDNEQERLAAEHALEGIFKSSEFVFGLSVHYEPTRCGANDDSQSLVVRWKASMTANTTWKISSKPQMRNLLSDYSWHALPVVKRRASALNVCFVRNDYYERRGETK